jgi:alkaline phosphatase D
MQPKWKDSRIERRRFLQYTWGAVGTSMAVALLPGERARAKGWGKNPFTLGVAAGDPTATGIVLWTRLAPEPANAAATGRWPIPVRWRVATDPNMRKEVTRGIAIASAQLAHSVHVELDGLKPRRDYWYQFDAGGEESAIGHFRTAASAFDAVEKVRFAAVTCQDWPSGFYTAYRDMLQQDLDLVLHLGDYTYEYAIGENNRGPVPLGFERETVDLETYRLRHTLHKLDPDLQAAHAKFAFGVIWDDHEVQNDYSGLAPEYAEPSAEFTARRAAAYQAYYEHMPIRLGLTGRPTPSLRIFRQFRYGDLVEFNLLDDRQYRDDNPCGDGEVVRCPEALQDDYSMLGRPQERWLHDNFMRSKARWNVVAQQLLLAELEHQPYGDELYWNDAWDGYPQARKRLFDSVLASKLSNPVFLTGDWHSTFVNDLKLDFKDPSSATIATELVTPAITTGGDATPYGPYYGPMVPYNPHIKYFEGDRRGYFAATVTREQVEFELRFVSSVQRQDGVGAREATFVVEDGVPGAQRV